MEAADRFRAILGPKGTPPTDGDAYDFDRIGSYFYNSASETECLQTIDAETTSDLDLNAVFERIDRTTTRVGQQSLYARLRTLRGEAETAAFGRDAARFAADPSLAERCTAHLGRLCDERAYELQNLIFDIPARVRGIGAAYLFGALAAASLLAALFHPLFLLLFAATFAANLYIHYDNKLTVTRYAVAVKQLAEALRTARKLAAEEVPGTAEAAASIRGVSTVERRSRIVAAQGDGGSELLAVAWLALEFLKIAFSIEVILFHRFMGSISAHREAIHALFRFIGRTDAALSVMRLRSEGGTCFPRFVEGKYLAVTQAVHPLIDGCVGNTLTLDGTGLLLSGSNMSGKTTFIRTLLLNALLAETIDTCFAEAYTAPYLKLFTSIRITDDLQEGTSYYLQEVLTVKRFIDAAEACAPCLFALDELFKGTNTTERIAAGKAVLARLNRGAHLVLCATHDIELAYLLRDEHYELHHFREEVADGRLVFDYRLHTGPLTTRNAIRILELCDYPPELIREAYDTQEELTRKHND